MKKIKIIAIFITLCLFGCKTERVLRIQLVNQKLSSSYLKEYYVVQNYHFDSIANRKIDSTAMVLGRSEGRNYHFYTANFFVSSKKIKKDSLYFQNTDSLSLSKNRKNLVNYFFYDGQFREKQTIKDGKIVPPKYESVNIIQNTTPVIKMVN